MKAIIILFEGECAQHTEQTMLAEICKSVYNNTTAKVEQITAFSMSDEEVNNALIKQLPTVNRTVQISPTLSKVKAYLDEIVDKVGSPALATKQAFRDAFMKRLMQQESLRNVRVLNIIFNDQRSKEVNEMLSKYGLDDLPNYAEDVRTVFRVFNYGKL